jgi:3'(2'), 5'-bisphosphate nucleotidase
MANFFNKSQIENIVACTLEAGEIAKNFFNTKNFEVEKKPDGSKVTSADKAVSKFLREKFANDFPQIPVICEEGDLRKIDGELFFLIDPIDGTSSFVSGSVEFAVNIALIKDKKAVFGLIYAPLFENGKMIFSDENNQIILNDYSGRKKIEKPSKIDQSTIRIITSSRSKDEDVQKYITEFYQNPSQKFIVEKLSSAIKFFRILENDADLYLHFRRSMEWDTAAGQALIELLGGKVKNLFFNQQQFLIGDEVSYKKPTFENHPFIASI